MKATKVESRRSFLNLGAGAAAAFGLSDLFSPRLFAAPRERAVVCLYLVGGNDSNNMIVPLDSPAYDDYARGRGALALARNVPLPVQGTPTARYGFHPNLPGLKDLYDRNAVAVVANVGRVAPDHKIAGDASDHIREMQVRYGPEGYLAIPWAVPGSTPLSRQSLLSLPHSVSVTGPDSHRLGHRTLAEAMVALPDQNGFPATQVGRQLSTVLSTLKLGIFSQPAFLVPVDGFETSYNQLERQAVLFTELDEALVAFYRAVSDLGKAGSVTVYTDTEFNRTLVPNKSGGTGHAWGGHQLVLGGSTLGGQIYGQFPSMQVGGADDAAGNGTWVPSTSSAHYAAAVASWYGKADLADVPAYAAALAGSTATPLNILVN